jgi:hypothetical protein
LIDSMIWRSGLNKPVPGRSGSPLRAGREQGDAELGQGGFELAAVIVLVRDQRLPDPAGQVRIAGEDRRQGVAFVGLGAGECETDRQPVQGAQQVQATASRQPVSSRQCHDRAARRGSLVSLLPRGVGRGRLQVGDGQRADAEPGPVSEAGEHQGPTPLATRQGRMTRSDFRRASTVRQPGRANILRDHDRPACVG